MIIRTSKHCLKLVFIAQDILMKDFLFQKLPLKINFRDYYETNIWQTDLVEGRPSLVDLTVSDNKGLIIEDGATPIFTGINCEGFAPQPLSTFSTNNIFINNGFLTQFLKHLKWF